MFGWFAKPKLIIALRSPGQVPLESQKAVAAYFQQEFPEHKVVFLPDGLSIEIYSIRQM